MSEPNPDNPTAEFKLSFDDEDVKVVLEFHFSDNVEEFFEPEAFVNAASAAVLKLLM